MLSSHNEGMDNILQKYQIPNRHLIEIDFFDCSCRLVGNDCRKQLGDCQPSIGLFWIDIADSLRHLIEQMSRNAPKFAPYYWLHCFNSTGNLLNPLYINGLNGLSHAIRTHDHRIKSEIKAINYKTPQQTITVKSKS